MSAASEGSLPLKITIRTALNVALVWAMAAYLDRYFLLTGGWRAVVIVGALLTLLNLVVRPVLSLLTMPLKLFATILAVIAVNGLFVWLVKWLVLQMDPGVVRLEIFGGVWGWIVVAAAIGFANWVMKEILR